MGADFLEPKSSHWCEKQPALGPAYFGSLLLLSKEMRKSIKPVGTRPSTMYGLCKVHKQEVDCCPSFRPILSVLQHPTYNLAKFLVPILNLFT